MKSKRNKEEIEIEPGIFAWIENEDDGDEDYDLSIGN